MNLKCKLAGHQWRGCRCQACGETRDFEHTFAPGPGPCHETCRVCGKTRDNKHQWEQLPERCAQKCSVCRQERPTDHEYQPVEGRCLEKCARCGHEEAGNHVWQYQRGKRRCSRCGAAQPLGENHKGLALYKRLTKRGAPLGTQPDPVPTLTFFSNLRLTLTIHLSGESILPFDMVWSGEYDNAALRRYLKGRRFHARTEAGAVEMFRRELGMLSSVGLIMEENLNAAYWGAADTFCEAAEFEACLAEFAQLDDAGKRAAIEQMYRRAYQRAGQPLA